MNNRGNWLLFIGALLIILGMLLKLFPGFKLFHLPGDIVVKKENFTLYFPITTMLLLSLLLSSIIYAAGRLLR